MRHGGLSKLSGGSFSNHHRDGLAGINVSRSAKTGRTLWIGLRRRQRLVKRAFYPTFSAPPYPPQILEDSRGTYGSAHRRFVPDSGMSHRFTTGDGLPDDWVIPCGKRPGKLGLHCSA